MRQSILKIAETGFVRSAIEEQADLAAFKEKPTPMVLAGVFAIGFSYIIGWPAVAALGILSARLHDPWIVIIGGPLTYGLSHLVFLLGMYLSGAVYSMIFLRWLARVSMEKLLCWANR
ncbi:MAG TPA: hypothetical protein ENG91_00235 [Desulfobacteraceae bacterium]|nr:hypothetical protein [Desulfobacteraceae bacterium]HDO29568.1 hypothetical protein [Desulfobacteraceae bacterium]HDZ76197.1 hypothetical protein [Desulfobacteraceae bacterium]